MKYIRQFLSFWYHFIVGDDWKVAVGVIGSLSIAALLVHNAHIQAWWLVPVLILCLLTLSLHLETRRK